MQEANISPDLKCIEIFLSKHTPNTAVTNSIRAWMGKRQMVPTIEIYKRMADAYGKVMTLFLCLFCPNQCFSSMLSCVKRSFYMIVNAVGLYDVAKLK